MIPWLIFAAVLVPLCIVGFVVSRGRSRTQDLEPGDEATQRRTEREFAESERYQEEWREQHRHDDDDRL